MKELAKTVGGISLSPLTYFGIVTGILRIAGYKIDLGILLILINSPAFLVGLGTSIGVSIFLILTLRRLQARLEPKRVWGNILKVVPFALLVIGTIFIFLSYRTDLWNNDVFNPSVFGAGVSIMAVGVAFLFVVYTRMGVHEGVTALTNRIETLNTKFDRLEKIADCFLDESQKLADRIKQAIEHNETT